MMVIIVALQKQRRTQESTGRIQNIVLQLQQASGNAIGVMHSSQTEANSAKEGTAQTKSVFCRDHPRFVGIG